MASISTNLAAAVEHHKAGRLPEAEELLRHVLAVEPEQPDVLHWLGVIAGQMGQPKTAVQYIQRSIRLKPDAANFQNNLGKVYHDWGKLPEAIASYRRARSLTRTPPSGTTISAPR